MAGETSDFMSSLLTDLTGLATAGVNAYSATQTANANSQVDSLKAQLTLQKQQNDSYAQSLGQLGVWYTQNQQALTRVAEWGLLIVGAGVMGYVLYTFTKRRR